MGEPRDTNRAHISPAAAKRVLVAMDAADLPAEPPGRGGPLPRIDGYIIERELGRGAGGVTYLAHKEGSEAKIALKVLHSRPGDGRASQRAWRELDTLQQVRVPSVPRLLDFGATDHSLYIATEYIEGTPLSDLYEHARPADLAEMRRRVHLLEKIARAAHALHERGVIHRDLKPSNVIVTRTSSAEGEDSVGEPFIIDLGIALIDTPDLHQTLTQDGQPVGTPAFMAPEQARGRREEISTRSDIYSLGAIGYWLCTGETPHDLTGVTLHEAIRRVGSEPPREARGISRAVPKGLGAVLGKACAGSPRARYSSAIGLCDDLGRWLGGGLVEAIRGNRWQRLGQWMMVHPQSVTLAACISLLAATLGLTAVSVRWFNALPFRIVRSTDSVELLARSQAVIHGWYPVPGTPVMFADQIPGSSAPGAGSLAAVGMAFATDDYSLPRFKVFSFENPDTPLWEAPYTAPSLSVPEEIGTWMRDDPPMVFQFTCATVADVYPEIPGLEILVVQAHREKSPSCISVFGVDGRVLSRAWHNGRITSAAWWPEPGLLIFGGVMDKPTLADLGVLGASAAVQYPVVVFACRPPPPRLEHGQMDELSVLILRTNSRELVDPIAWRLTLSPPELSALLYAINLQRVGPDELEIRATSRAGYVAATLVVTPQGRFVRSVPEDALRHAFPAAADTVRLVPVEHLLETMIESPS